MTSFDDPKKQAGGKDSLIIAEDFIELGLNDLFLKLQDPNNPVSLLDPIDCALALKNHHSTKGMLWSYGGYLEDRADFLQGGSQAEQKETVHLGVDVNVPYDTPVVLPKPIKVVDIVERDSRLGPHLLFEQEDFPGYLGLLAHLGSIEARVGQVIPARELIGRVGVPPENGGQHPHLHIQRIKTAHYNDRQFLSSAYQIPEYSEPDRPDFLSSLYPDPIDLVDFDHYSKVLAA